jgi:hypothetical protein
MERKISKNFDIRDKNPMKRIWLYAKRYNGKTIKYQISYAPVDITIKKNLKKF